MLQQNVGAQPNRAFAAPPVPHDAYIQQGYGLSGEYGQFQAFDTPEQPQQREREQEQQPSGPSSARKAGPAKPIALGTDPTNRKLLDLPPVVGSTIQFPNKHLKYRPIPHDLDAVRDKLFRFDKELLLDSQQICDYWLHMTNVYQRSTKPERNHNDTVTEVWECRNRRRVKIIANPPKESQGRGQRNKNTKDDILGDVAQCKLRIRFISYTKHHESCPWSKDQPGAPPGFMSCKCIPEWVHMERTEKTKEYEHQHEHDIAMLDRFKRSDAIMYYAKVLVEQRYTFACVHKWILKKYTNKSQEVQYLNKQDVSNVGRPWRLLNKDVELKGEIEEENDVDKQRNECLDAIHTTSQSQLAKALTEVCRRIPEAVDIIIPFMEKAADGDESSSRILEAEDIVVPEPGLPKKREVLYAYVRPVLNQQPHTPDSTSLQTPTASSATAAPYASTATAANTSMHTRADPARPGQFVLSKAPAASPSGPAANTGDQRPRSSSLHDTLNATLTDPDPEAASRILASAASNSRFSLPYDAASKPRAPTASRSSATAWPPPSITHPVAQSNQPRPGTGERRPTWAQPTPSKRSAADSPSSSTQAPKRTLYEEIRTQLRSELTSIPP
ncbi:hypothetical protein HII31_10312 [Pseudocercospora fuligena]|uniref:Uncharacterized protein n=1 Tax=Pseudocercospora fuligena TaxID=685502 RepID=A0A8H6VEQ7_9PEZI|nr:hypothetical protein HII31_10312 [Pseudocercospora fuligena]